MSMNAGTINGVDREVGRARNSINAVGRIVACALYLLATVAVLAKAQVNVVTGHNDISRTGQNLNETILTPANVSAPGSFGKLFSQTVTGGVYAQPLYVANVTIPGLGVHNVLYVLTTQDIVYAFDADSNGGIDAAPLWTKLMRASGAQSDYTYATPVIDLSSKTLYTISSEIISSTEVFKLHALDITTGAERFGGPVQIQASVAGTGTGSSGGVLTFNPAIQQDRPGMLELNGILYFAFGSSADNGAWHGWLYSYNASTLAQIDAWALNPNGSGSGIWMGGSGLAAEVNNPAKPYGRMFLATGNGSYSASQPYTRSMNLAMSVLDLDLTGGTFTVEDEFTPYNQAEMDGQDGDLGSGGPLLLPTQTTASGGTLSPLVEVGKSGEIYILNRNNLGGFNAAGDQVVQEVQTPTSGAQNWGAGLWGTSAYWNNNLYFGGTNPGGGNSLTTYSFNNGVLSPTPTSHTAQLFYYPGPTPSISANGAANAIVWVIQVTQENVDNGVLLAYDATNLANLLYSSNANLLQDNPGTVDHFAVPTIANGKVYVGASSHVNIYGLSSAPVVAPPAISPDGSTFTGSQTVTITDTTAGAQIFYTTDGTTPTVNSTLYTGPITVTATETISAIASATAYLQGAPVSATFRSTANAANPVFSLPAGAYTGTQTLTIAAAAGAIIYYTVDGATPTTSSSVYSGPIPVKVSETVQALATAPGLLPSSIVSAGYTITPAYVFDFSQGFADAQDTGQMRFNGSTDLDDFRLQLTNGGLNEAGSAFYTTPVNIQTFTTDFTFQLSNPGGDGITFTIQNVGPTALGTDAQRLGYGGISHSVAIYFNTHNNVGQGNDATGLYLDGSTASPAVPPIDLNKTGINLRSGDYMNIHVTYDGSTLNVTITDALTLASWSHAYPLDIPYHVGGKTAYLGFTGGTGGTISASQKLIAWSYLVGSPPVPNFPAGFDASGLVLNGNATLSGTTLQLTDGATNEVSSAYYANPVDIDSFTTDFDFTISKGKTSELADGFTFVIQKTGNTALGTGSGGLGYAGIGNSFAMKFDVFNNAGEGTDSIGFYSDGAMPTEPSINLAASGMPMYPAYLIHVHLAYNGSVLTWSLARLNSEYPATANGKTTINIPTTIGSNTGYVGFTGSSGDGTAIQQIQNWTLTSP